MKTIRVNGVNITINGDADVNVDRYGNVSVNVRPKTIYIERPPVYSGWPKPYFPTINIGNNPKHWLK